MHPDAADVVRTLSLLPHPEGGFYRETFRARLAVRSAIGPRAASTAIYFLLPAGGLSALHRVRSDEVWHYYDGDPVELHTIDTGGTHATVILGPDILGGERPQHVIEAGTWQAAVARGERYALCGCTVSPGFDFADFEMPTREAMLRLFPALGATIERLTRG
jgi:predicted cupin superfamily sugar epimerase